ncbi:hypothetical protein ACRYI5_09330 [Furfurilactobacillus sp. WILCCON 0119]
MTKICLHDYPALTQAGFTFILAPANARVLYGVVKRLHVRPTDSYYDDVCSEGRLQYVQVYVEYVLKFTSYDPEQLRRYAYQRLYWRLLDWLRATTRTMSHQAPLTETTITKTTTTDFTAPIADHAFLTQVLARCTDSERQLLTVLLVPDQSVTTAASQLHISRPTLYRRRRALAATLRHRYPTLFPPE